MKYKYTIFKLLFVFIATVCNEALAENDKGEDKQEKKNDIKIDPETLTLSIYDDSNGESGALVSQEKPKYSLKIGGWVKLNAIYDFNGIGPNPYPGFMPVEIPTDPTENAMNRSFHMNINQTRIWVDSYLESKTFGTIKFYLEGDFLRTTNNNLRLRHAFIEVNEKLIIGQTWSTFSDGEALPLNVEFEGPASLYADWGPQIRYSDKINDRFSYQVALETPTANITRLDSLVTEDPSKLNARPKSQFPNVVGKLRYSHKRGFIHLSGIMKDLRYYDIKGEVQNDIAWGAQLSGALNVAKNTKVYFQGIYGKGIASGISGFYYFNYDATPNIQKTNLEALTAMGGYFALEHRWSPKVFSNIMYSVQRIDERELLEDNDYYMGHYFAVNTFYNPIERFEIGFEYNYGIRLDADMSQGDANRIQTSVRYFF
ncbi:DcaP family trimeric outer membrane transporter [Aureibacter tunicatorum]|uniref:Porin n=1 Tax=Aureibacter tunicatorum TaxID=866807 RepID=A0AAE4BSA0_9BACT|nr:DcaP family trimeric outer membrane transporter [Aureibacter tunicatorum]MDR6238152.1 hypothetical protein [Aureibacter tunicatorum]BDD03185.1 hypothetical protein AUTU_06680 [Aureibacter tunicatorum]